MRSEPSHYEVASDSSEDFIAGAPRVLGCWQLDRARGPAPPAQETPAEETPPPPPAHMPSMPARAPPPPPPAEEPIAPQPRTIAEIESAVRSAVESSVVPPASQARPGVDCLLWLCVQAGHFREAVEVRVFDHRTGVEVRVRRAVEQEVLRFEHVSLDAPTRALAHQFLEGTRDHDEVEVRHSLEVLTAR